MLGGIMAKAGLQRCIADEGVFVPTPNTTLPPSSELAIGLRVYDLIGIATPMRHWIRSKHQLKNRLNLRNEENQKKCYGWK
jgi:hypothetical protein